VWSTTLGCGYLGYLGKVPKEPKMAKVLKILEIPKVYKVPNILNIPILMSRSVPVYLGIPTTIYHLLKRTELPGPSSHD